MVGAALACGVVGRRGHAHARMQKVELTLEQKVLIFGANPAVRLGSVRPGGGAGAQGRQRAGVQGRQRAGARSHQLVASRTRAFPDRHWPIKHVE